MVITTDAPKRGWVAVRDHHTTGGQWSPVEAELHKNELELKVVLLHCIHYVKMLVISTYALCQII